MRFFKYLLPLVVAVGFSTASAHADCIDPDNFNESLLNRDFDALNDFINTKRTINLEEKDCNLTISGDVRAEWNYLTEKQNCEVLRGRNAVNGDGIPVSHNEFDIEFNLRFDYVCDRAWAVAELRFDNPAGIRDNNAPCGVVFNEEELSTSGTSISGTDVSESISGISDPSVSEASVSEDGGVGGCHCACCPDPEGWHGSGLGCGINLRKAYVGYNICCQGDSRFDVEVGRRPLYTIFDSEVQFLSRFDGILLKYDSSWECVADWYIHGGGFVVDQNVNHFAWVVEAGFMNVMDCGFDFKYSFIDWVKNGHNICFIHKPLGFAYKISQFTLVYHLNENWFWCKPAKLFGAFLVNHDVRRDAPQNLFADGLDSLTNGKKANLAWYAGFSIGEVVRECDWVFKAQYQYVQARAVPEFDMSGIGNGNIFGNGLTAGGIGNTNFHGFRLEGLYAITDNLTIAPLFELSRTIDKNIGNFPFSNHHKYSRFTIQSIYSF